MTVAPTLQKGLKRLFSSSVLRIIGALLLVASVIAMLVGLFLVAQAVGGDELTSEITRMFEAAANGNYAALNEQIEVIANTDAINDPAVVSAVSVGAIIMVAGAVLVLIAGILVIIALIMSLVGVVNVSKENNRFKIALYAVLASLILSIIGSFIANGDPTATAIFTLLSRIADIVMFLFVCDGIRALGEKLQRSDFFGKYNAILLLYALAAVLDFAGKHLGVSTIAYVIQLVGNICSIVSFILYMGYLRKAIKAVQGVPIAEPQI